MAANLKFKKTHSSSIPQFIVKSQFTVNPRFIVFPRFIVNRQFVDWGWQCNGKSLFFSQLEYVTRYISTLEDREELRIVNELRFDIELGIHDELRFDNELGLTLN